MIYKPISNTYVVSVLYFEGDLRKAFLSIKGGNNFTLRSILDLIIAKLWQKGNLLG